MTTQKIIEYLQSDIDKTIRLTYKDGDVDVVVVLNVDDEGFVFQLVQLNHGEQDTMQYWTRFSDVADESFQTKFNLPV